MQVVLTTQAQVGGLREGVKSTKKVYFAENLCCVFRQEQGRAEHCSLGAGTAT